MEYPIDKIANNQLDDIIVQSKFQCNSLSISLPYEYVNTLICLNWNDILFALENGFLSASTVVEYALNELSAPQEATQTVMDLAYMSITGSSYDSHTIRSATFTLAQTVPDHEKDKTKEKMLYVLLNAIYETRDWFEEPLKVIEVIYDDFGFPASILNLIQYMPTNDTGLASSRIGRQQLLKKWENYLKKRKELHEPQDHNTHGDTETLDGDKGTVPLSWRIIKTKELSETAEKALVLSVI